MWLFSIFHLFSSSVLSPPHFCLLLSCYPFYVLDLFVWSKANSYSSLCVVCWTGNPSPNPLQACDTHRWCACPYVPVSETAWILHYMKRCKEALAGSNTGSETSNLKRKISVPLWYLLRGLQVQNLHWESNVILCSTWCHFSFYRCQRCFDSEICFSPKIKS